MKVKQIMIVLFIIIALLLVIIVGMSVKNKKEGQNPQGPTVGMVEENKIEEFVEVQEDGSKINTSKELSKTKKIDGKDYYILSSKMNTNFLYNTNTTKMTIYVEKNTGLTTKIVEEVNENGEIKEIYKDFEYKFNNVTDEDISEPDNSEYKMQENSNFRSICTK